MGPGAPTSEDAGGSKRRIQRDIVYSMGERKAGVPTIEDSTWVVKPPAGALEAGALCPDGLGLLTVVVDEEGDERGRPSVLNGTTCAPGGNGGTVLGGNPPTLGTNRRDRRES